MKKSVLLSIQPKWCELISSGKKTVEIRKTKPKLKTPFKCYIYCTKPSKKHQTICGCMVLNSDELYRHPKQGIKYGDSIELMCCDDYTEDNFLNGKVIGEFICDEITSGYWIAPFEDYLQSASCLTKKELTEYSNGKLLYYWHISDLKMYDKPKELGKFYTVCNRSGNIEDRICLNCPHLCFDSDPINGYTRWCGVYKKKPLKKPPQSWCYVEEKKANDEL